MQPTSLPAWQENLEVRFDLTQQDIEVLYEIVTYAAVVPETTPWNALINAYHGVLRDRGIDPGQDDIWFRVLIRMADLRTGTWHEKYVYLLQKWGYQTPEFENGSNDETISISQAGHLNSPPRQALRIMPNAIMPSKDKKAEIRKTSNEYPQQHHGSLGTSRGAQINGAARANGKPRATNSKNVYDAEEQRRRQYEAARAEFAFPGTAVPGVGTESSSVGYTSQEEDVVSSSAIVETSPSAYAPASSPPQPPLHHTHHARSAPPPRHHLRPPLHYESPNIPREYTTVHDFLSSEQDDIDDTTKDHESAYTELLPPIRSQPEYIRAATNAAQFYNLRLQNLIQRMFTGWWERTARVQEYHQLQERVAKGYDRQVLLRQTLELWREGAYWKGIGHRSARKRELELMRKIFDIWKSKTKVICDRRQRVNNGLLMHKCFVAWRKHAAEMSSKVKSVQLRAFLHLWQRKLQDRRAALAQADVVYENNLKYRAYWSWYFYYCGSRVPLYHDHRLKRQVMDNLRNQVAVRRIQYEAAEHHYNSVMAKRCLLALRAAYNKQEERSEAAERHHVRTQLTQTLSYWRKASKLQPAADSIRDLVNDRVTYEYFTQWRARSKQEVAAKQIDKIRLLRSTFRLWNMELRGKVLRAKVDQRLLTDVTYTWVLRWRQNLFIRVRDRRLLTDGLDALTGRIRTLPSTYTESEARLSTLCRKHALANAFSALRGVRDQLAQREDRAAAVYRRALLHGVFQAMKDKLGTIHQMNQDAEAAAYYSVTKAVLRKWGVSWAETSKRRVDEERKRMKEQRKAIYKTVVKKRNTRIARQCLRALRDKLDNVRGLSWRLRHYSSAGSEDLLRSSFAQWRAQLLAVKQNSELAEDMFRERTLGNDWSKWKGELQRVEELRTLEGVYHDEIELDLKKSFLEKWRDVIWKKKAVDTMNDKILERVENRTKKKYLRGWLLLLRERRTQRQRNLFGGRHQSFSPEDDRVDSMAESSQLDINDWIQPPASPSLIANGFSGSRSLIRYPVATTIEAPRYPSTPGGRAARARAMMSKSMPPLARLNLMTHARVDTSVSTTPVGTPLRKGSFVPHLSPSVAATQTSSQGHRISRNEGFNFSANSTHRQRANLNGTASVSSSSRIPVFQHYTSTASTLEVDDVTSVNGKLNSPGDDE